MAVVHAFDVLGDPVRRRILELLATGRADLGGADHGRPGRVRDLAARGLPAPQVLRDTGSPPSARRVRGGCTRVRTEPLRDVDAWLDGFRRFWTPHLDALATELARGRRERRLREQDHPDERTTP